MQGLAELNRLNTERMDQINYPRLHSDNPRISVEVAAGIVSIEEDMAVSRVREIIAEVRPRDMPELRRAVRTIKSFTNLALCREVRAFKDQTGE